MRNLDNNTTNTTSNLDTTDLSSGKSSKSTGAGNGTSSGKSSKGTNSGSAKSTNSGSAKSTSPGKSSKSTSAGSAKSTGTGKNSGTGKSTSTGKSGKNSGTAKNTGSVKNSSTAKSSGAGKSSKSMSAGKSTDTGKSAGASTLTKSNGSSQAKYSANKAAQSYSSTMADFDVVRTGTSVSRSRGNATTRSTSLSGSRGNASSRSTGNMSSRGTDLNNSARTGMADVTSDINLGYGYDSSMDNMDSYKSGADGHSAKSSSSKGNNKDTLLRKKRRKRIKKLLKLWANYKYYIIAVAVVIVLTVAGVIVYACTHKEPATIDVVEQDTQTDDYSAIFDDEKSGGLFKKKDKKKVTPSVTAEAGEEIEYKTLLEYKEDAKNGYMNNCIFLGDSRTVAMVSYGFVSDENVLAQVGISHPSVEKTTFVQNSGKQYTLKSYLESHQAPVIYIGYGVNGMGGSDEQYEKSYTKLVEHIMELAPNSKIVLMSIWPVDDYGTYRNTVRNEWVNKYNKFLEALAEHEEIYYLDVNQVLTGSDGQIKPEYDAGDGLHYRACAYTVILDYIIHHPVPGISDEGEFIVKYVKPTGDFKKMQKEKVPLPSNVQEVRVEELLTPTPTPTPEEEGEPTPTPTPTPTPKPEEKPTPEPTTLTPPPPPPSEPQGEPQGDPSPEYNPITPSPTPTPEPTSEPTNEPTSEPTDEPTSEPTDTPPEEPEAPPEGEPQ